LATIKKLAENKYQVRYSVYDETGKRNQKSKQFTKSGDAKKFKIEVEKQLMDNTYIEDTKETLRQYLNDWLEIRKKRLAINSYENYKNLIERVSKIIGSKLLNKVTPVHIRKCYDELLDVLSPNSVLHIHRIINKAFKDAVRDQIINKNPCQFVETPTSVRFEAGFLQPEEIPTLLNMFKDNEIYPAVALGVLRGFRRGEILALRWADIDFKNNTIYIRHNINWGKDGYTLDKPKTKNSVRTIPISKQLKELLEEHKKKQLEYKQIFWGKYYKSDFVVTHKNGTLIKPGCLSNMFTRELAKNKFRHIRFHDLRHTAASLMLAEGIQLKVVSEMLGHSSISITADLYSHVIDTLKRDAGYKLDEKYL